MSSLSFTVSDVSPLPFDPTTQINTQNANNVRNLAECMPNVMKIETLKQVSRVTNESGIMKF